MFRTSKTMALTGCQLPYFRAAVIICIMDDQSLATVLTQVWFKLRLTIFVFGHGCCDLEVRRAAQPNPPRSGSRVYPATTVPTPMDLKASLMYLNLRIWWRMVQGQMEVNVNCSQIFIGTVVAPDCKAVYGVIVLMPLVPMFVSVPVVVSTTWAVVVRAATVTTIAFATRFRCCKEYHVPRVIVHTIYYMQLLSDDKTMIKVLINGLVLIN